MVQLKLCVYFSKIQKGPYEAKTCIKRVYKAVQILQSREVSQWRRLPL